MPWPGSLVAQKTLRPDGVHWAAVVVQLGNSFVEPRMDDFCSMGRNQGCSHSSRQCSPWYFFTFLPSLRLLDISVCFNAWKSMDCIWKGGFFEAVICGNILWLLVGIFVSFLQMSTVRAYSLMIPPGTQLLIRPVVARLYHCSLDPSSQCTSNMCIITVWARTKYSLCVMPRLPLLVSFVTAVRGSLDLFMVKAVKVQRSLLLHSPFRWTSSIFDPLLALLVDSQLLMLFQVTMPLALSNHLTLDTPL